MRTRIHVNQHALRHNRNTGERLPVLSVKDYKANRYGFEAVLKGPSRVVYRPECPLACGAVLWVETDGEVEVLA